jgi:hypothetical protein
MKSQIGENLACGGMIGIKEAIEKYKAHWAYVPAAPFRCLNPFGISEVATTNQGAERAA